MGGIAVGAGVNIAMACDMVVGPESEVCDHVREMGLHPGGGCSWFLTRRMGGHRALATRLDAERIDAEEAFRAGLVTRLVEDPWLKRCDGPPLRPA